MSQKDEKSRPEKWQINILHDIEKTSTIILTVTENCCTAELFEKLRQHPKVPQTDDFQLFSISGTVRGALVESWEERLSNYGITDRSTLALVVVVDGGVWPTAKEVEAEPRHLKPAEGIALTTISDEHPDVLCVECDGPGVILRCGHATAPMPLALYCHSELEKGKDEIRCPKCDVKWKFALLKPAACLTPNEITEFEQRAHINYFRSHQSEMNPCPKCGTFSRTHRAEDKRVVCTNCTRSSGKTFQFCWTCLREWKNSGNQTCGNPDCGSKKGLLEILANCETKKLNGIEIPSKRACPNCSIIIDHKKGCKHMTCRCCSYEFCFICLKKFPCGSGLFDPCDMAPCQTSDTNFIGASDITEKQLYSAEESDESSNAETDDDDTRYGIHDFYSYLALQEGRLAALRAELHESPINVVSTDDVTVSMSNDTASSITMSASENTVNAGNTTVENTSRGNDTEDRSNLGRDDAHANSASNGHIAQLQTNNDIKQRNETLETKEVQNLASATTDTSRPASRSGIRRFCIIQ